MSDFTPDAGAVAPDTSAPAAASPTPSAPVAPPTGAAVGGDDSILDGDLPNQPLFDQGYVRDLRGRATQYRTQVRDLEGKIQAYQVFDRYEPDDRQVWIDLASTWAQDPKQAAQMMQAIAGAVMNEAGADGGTSPGGPPPGDVPTQDEMAELTPEAVQKMIADGIAGFQAKQAEQQAVEQVYSEVRSGGYDPETMDGFMVLWLANNQTGGDIPKAIESLKARDQAIIDGYVQGRTGTPQAGVAPSNGAVAASTPTAPASWDDTRKAAQAFLNSQAGVGQA